MPQPVTLYLRRETDQGKREYFGYLESGRAERYLAWFGHDLWQSLGLPEVDGEHALKVVLDE